MSEIRDESFKLEIAGNEYNLTFNINIIDAFQDKFNRPLTDIGEMAYNERTMYKTIRFLLYAMINDAIEEYNETHQDKKQLVTEFGVGRMLTVDNILKIASQLMDGISYSMPAIDEDTPRK